MTTIHVPLDMPVAPHHGGFGRYEIAVTRSINAGLVQLALWHVYPSAGDEDTEATAELAAVKLTPEEAAQVMAAMGQQQPAPIPAENDEVEPPRIRVAKVPDGEVARGLHARIGEAVDSADEALAFLDANQDGLAQSCFTSVFKSLTTARPMLADAQVAVR